MKSEFRILRLSFLLVVISSQLLFSKEYHVAVTGSDAVDGTPRKPFRTIQHVTYPLDPGIKFTTLLGGVEATFMAGKAPFEAKAPLTL